MGQSPGDKSEPSLELPSLSPFGRRKKEKRSRVRERRAARQDPAPDPVEEEPTATLRTYEEPTTRLESPAQDPTPADVPLGEPAPDTTLGYQPAPQTEHTRNYEPALDHDPTTGTEAPGVEAAELPGPGARSARKAHAQRSAPRLPGGVATALTGVLVGAAGGAATYGAMTACELVRGVSTCGGAPGFFILVAIFAFMVLLGGGVLRLLEVEAPGSTSFLAVGLVAVVVMLVLLDVIFSVWMFVVIPALGALAYLVAHWVTTRFDDGSTGRRDWT